MEKKSMPILGISMGDPAGIGPEIALKALGCREVYRLCRPVIVGDAGVMEDALRITCLPLSVNAVTRVIDAKFEYGTVDVLDLKNVDMARLNYGEAAAMPGNAAFEAVVKLIELALAGEVDATVTGPINKEAINLAGHHFAVHTEIYAHYTNTEDYTMMLAHGNLRVVHVSTHVSLAQACALVEKSRVLDVIKLAHGACKSLGIENPRIGVAGLNPHAGENGLFGKEEIEQIIPAIKAARSEGIDADGPVPPDTLFSKALGGWYDIVVAMYHDQGHIPLKTIGFRWDEKAQKWGSVSGVNITLGLPIIRCSVDHGTAFDNAGKGIADDSSLVSAIEYAAAQSAAGFRN